MCLNEVKSWQNENLSDNYFVVKETRANKSHGSVILAKKRTTIIEVKPEKCDWNERGKVFKIKKPCFEVPVIGHLWVIALYNSPGRDLNLSEIFETEMKNGFICGDFNAPHQELNCTYNTENGDKIVETIETGTLKFLYDGYHTYQSYQGDDEICLIYISPINQSSKFLTQLMFLMTLVVTTAQPLLPWI